MEGKKHAGRGDPSYFGYFGYFGGTIAVHVAAELIHDWFGLTSAVA